MRNASLCLFALLLMLASGCEKELDTRDYFPLRDGNLWEYRMLDLPLLKRLAEGKEVEVANIDAELRGEFDEPADAAKPEKGEVVVEGRRPGRARRVRLELRNSVDPLTFRALYDSYEQVWSKKQGYIGFQGGSGRSYLLILPPYSDQKWVVTTAAGQDLYFSIENIRATVETPAGSFANCVISRQESRDGKEVYKYWFAPSVGLVRRSKIVKGTEVFRQELVEYKVKEALLETRKAEEVETNKAWGMKGRGQEFRNRDKKEERAVRNADGAKETDDKIEKFSDPK